jgi:hypothetical protein
MGLAERQAETVNEDGFIFWLKMRYLRPSMLALTPTLIR